VRVSDGLQASFQSAARAAFGPSRRLAFDDGFSAVGYLWNEEESFWPAVSPPPGYDPLTDPFSDASGAGLFEAAHGLLTGLGVRVPEIYLLDRTGAFGDADVALVEQVRAGKLEELLRVDVGAAAEVMARLAGTGADVRLPCRGLRQSRFHPPGWPGGRVLRAGRP